MAKAKGSGRLATPARKGQAFEFKYTPSHSTDIRKTFERARAEQDQAQAIDNVKKLERRR